MEKMIKVQKLKRKRKHGFLEKMKTHGGKKTIQRRRAKKRSKLSL